ncbi:hypothetical protein MJO29_009298, partial [Puccinia striiformis f. sp. tritici]
MHDDCVGVALDKWKSTHTPKKIAPVNCQVEFLHSVHVEPCHTYAPHALNQNNYIIWFGVTAPRQEICFARINQIFMHKRVTLVKQTHSDTWLVVTVLGSTIQPRLYCSCFIRAARYGGVHWT